MPTLDITLCKKCMDEIAADTLFIPSWTNRDEKLWEQEEHVSCPVECTEEEINKRATKGNIHDVPPRNCPYLFQQLMALGISDAE